MRLAKSMILTAMLTGVIWGQTSITVSDFGALQTAVTAGGGKTINVAGSFEMTAPLTIPAGANITIRSDAARTLTLASGVSGSMFTVAAGAALTLNDGVTLTGRSGNIAPVVTVAGTFTMNGGTITGNSSSSTDGAARCGGVGIGDNGTFNMFGGAVTGNTYTGNGGFGTGAGGVMVSKGATFNMHGGEVSDNTNSYMSSSSSSSSNGSGGVYVSDGTFNMYDGAVISGNRQTGNFNFAAAGGLYLANVSQFNMYGGTISNNSAVSVPSGDGIYNSATSYIKLTGTPVVNDGAWFHSTASSPSFAARLQIGEGGLEDGALIVVQGCTQASQMAPPQNLTATFPGLTPTMAKAFISKDKKLVGKVQGNRVVWADNYDLALFPATDKNFGASAYDYGALSAHSVTIYNTGLGQTNELTITLGGIGAGAFTLSKETVANIAAGANDNFTVAPKTGLDAGTYAATVTVTGEYDISVSFNVSFNVTPAAGAGTVSIAGWIYGGLPNNPTTADTPADYAGAVTYAYKTQGAADNTYSTAKPVNAGNYTVRAVFSATNNYNEHSATANFAITKAPLTVTAASQFIKYDDPPPAYGAAYNGFVNNENESVLGGTLSFTCAYVKGNDAGTYPITPSGLTSNNYDITFVDGTLTVAQNTDAAAGYVGITGWTYGAAPNAPVYSSTNGTVPVIQYKLKAAADATYSPDVPKNAGAYTVRATFPSTSNFAECSATADFTISKTRLIVMPIGSVITYGDPAPAPTVFYRGFVNKESAATLGVNPTLTCDYKQGDDAGDYVIKASGVELDNYDVEFWDGILTVERYSTAINVTVNDKVYDGNASAEAFAASVRYQYDRDGGGNDEIFVVPGTAVFADKNAGVNKGVTFGGWTLGGAKAHNYNFAQPKKASASITPKPIAVRADNIAYGGKTYDGTAGVDRNDVSITLDAASGIIGWDNVTANFTSAAFDRKDAARAGEERMITVSGITLQGADAGNYSLINTAAVKASEIRRRNLIVKVDNKLVRTDADPLSIRFDSYTLSGLAESDGSGNGLFGDDNPISFGIGPDIESGHDYWPMGSMTLNAGVYPVTPYGELDNYAITPMSGLLTISDKADVCGKIAFDGGTFEYDGAPKSVAAVYSGGSSGTPSYTYQYFGTILSGAEYPLTTTPPTEAGTYFVNVTYEDDDNIGKASATVTITPKPVTIINVTANNKVYDGNTNASVTAGMISGMEAVDSGHLTIAAGAASFADRNAGTDKVVTLGGWTLGGAKAHNYALTGQPANTTANILPKAITISASDIDYDGKVYDGTTATGLSMFVLSAASGLVSGDAAAASVLPNGSAVFNSKDAGARTVTVSGLTLRGPNAGNYILSSTPVNKTGVIIEKRDITVKAEDKLITVGTPLPAFTYRVSGLVTGEIFGASASAYLDNQSSYGLLPNFNGTAGKHVITITPSAAEMENNYNIIYQTGILTVSDKTDISAQLAFTGAANDTVTVTYNGSPQPVAANEFSGSSPAAFAYTYTGVSESGIVYNSSDAPPTDAGRYVVDVTYEDAERIGKKSVTLIIKQKPLAIIGAAHTKPYDGTRNAVGITVTLDETGIAANDAGSVTIASVTAMYASPSAGTTTVSIREVTLAGSRASNYAVTPKEVEVEGITSKHIAAHVGISGWTYGEPPSTPFVYGAPDDYPVESVTFDYKTGADFSVTPPTLPGVHIVRATFPAHGEYDTYVTSAVFTIGKKTQAPPYIPGLAEREQANKLNALIVHPDLDWYVPRIPFDTSGLTMEVSAASIRIIRNNPESGDRPNTQIKNWESRLEGVGGWGNTHYFDKSIEPNSEYIIFIRMMENDTCMPSSEVAILVRTPSMGTVPVNDDDKPNAPPPVFITAPATDKRHGVMLAKTVVSRRAEFSVSAPERSTVNVAVYDNMGNVVFRQSGLKSDESISWNLTNASGRGVANGTYLIVATSRGKGGNVQRYSQKVMVRR